MARRDLNLARLRKAGLFVIDTRNAFLSIGPTYDWFILFAARESSSRFGKLLEVSTILERDCLYAVQLELGAREMEQLRTSCQVVTLFWL